MNRFDVAAARCLRYRRKILDMSQRVSALHIGGAFSCIEILDVIYNELADRDDTVILSKGHAGIAQYVILNDRLRLSDGMLEGYCTAGGDLGVHPTLGNPGISCSTGSLGHGLGMAVGMAIAERIKGSGAKIWCVLSDGECMEGSTWEAAMMAAALDLQNLVVFVDQNGMQSFGHTESTHPHFFPLEAKFKAFGWSVETVDGHAGISLLAKAGSLSDPRPRCVIAETVKGKGVSFMENVAQWHYRSPTPDEYQRAIAELGEVRA